MKKLITISIILIQANLICSQSLNSKYLDSLIVAYSKEYSIVGLSIGITYNHKTETKSFGQTSYDSNVPITDSTLFNNQ